MKTVPAAPKRLYGRLGELTKETKSIADNGTWRSFTTAYEWDSLGRLRNLVYPNGEGLAYGYDHGGLVTSAYGYASGKTQTYVKSIKYNCFGQRSKIEYGNGTIAEYSYDPAMHRLVNLTTKNAEGSTFQNLSYTYDEAGNITKRTDTDFVTTGAEPKSTSQNYSYDSMNRLISANGSYNFELLGDAGEKRLNNYTGSFVYDSIGNILTKEQINNGVSSTGGITPIESTTYTYNYEYASFRPHAVTKAGPKTFTYDLSGNMTSMKDTASGLQRTMTWDNENRMLTTVDNGVTTSYAYDNSGTRVYKKGKFGTVLYPNNNYTVRNNDAISLHVFVGNTRVATKMLCNEEVNGTVTSVVKNVFYYLADHLGSSSVITNTTGNFYERIEYFPYGETWVHEKPTSGESVPYKYTGKELDPETGLYYVLHRYRDPITGGWLSTDPILNEYLPTGNKEKDNNLPGMGGVFNPVNLNLYHYAGNNPINLIDPDGNSLLAKLLNSLLEVMGFPVQNRPPRYVNQKTDVEKDRQPLAACGISSDAMMTDMNPNVVDEELRVKEGKGDFAYRQGEENIVGHIKGKGYTADNITGSDGSARSLTDKDFEKLRDSMRDGKMILYHFRGHYTVMSGYFKVGEKNKYIYFFHDPAGDRKKGYFNTHGKNAIYSQDYLKTQLYRGNAWGIEQK